MAGGDLDITEGGGGVKKGLGDGEVSLALFLSGVKLGDKGEVGRAERGGTGDGWGSRASSWGQLASNCIM